MALSWNEIKDRVLKFSDEWAGASREDADVKPFLDAFFDVFGITRKKIGTFEHPESNLYHFGILMSKMHMAWVNVVCGRLESRYRYSNEIVYNNFPWAENPTKKQVQSIEKAAQKILDVRKKLPNDSLAVLYDPETMPPILKKAHNELDKAVDLTYRPQPFTREVNRLEFLFSLYEKYTADLFTKMKSKRMKKGVPLS